MCLSPIVFIAQITLCALSSSSTKHPAPFQAALSRLCLSQSTRICISPQEQHSTLCPSFSSTELCVPPSSRRGRVAKAAAYQPGWQFPHRLAASGAVCCALLGLCAYCAGLLLQACERLPVCVQMCVQVCACAFLCKSVHAHADAHAAAAVLTLLKMARMFFARSLPVRAVCARHAPCL